VFLKKNVKTREKLKKNSGYMYEFQDLTPISGHFRTNFRNFRKTLRPEFTLT